MANRSEKEREFTFRDNDFKFLSKLVHDQVGIVLGDHKKDMVYGRLARRLRQLDIPQFSEYCDLLTGPKGDAELGHLVNAITTNLTSFFRESHHFEHLAKDVLAPMAMQPSKRLRIWSAGCSSGAEPYSIAMTVRKALPNIGSWDARILATDIDTNMLDIGRRGEYAPEQYDKIPQPYRDLAQREEHALIMADSLRRLITFNQLNLLEKWPIKGPFDAIFCRNVLIYFDKDTQRTLFNRYADLLKPDGWLYIGHSENLFNVCDRFKLVGRTIYKKVK